MTQTRVVHVNSPEWAQAVKDGTAVYIGRAVPRRSMKGSKWANPFPISAELSRAGAVEKYRAWLTTQDELIAALPELYGKMLGCWCKPEPCHGDVLVELVHWKDDQSLKHHPITGRLEP